MGFRLRKSKSFGPVRVNFSKSGVGYSIGGKGFRATKKAGGGYRTTASIPGTGVSYTKDYSNRTTRKPSGGKYSTPPSGRPIPPKSKLTEFLLCLFLGYFGAHRFYMRKYGTGFLYLLTFGCFGIGWLVDTVRLAFGIFSKGSTKKEKTISAACIACMLLLSACAYGPSDTENIAPTVPTLVETETVEASSSPVTAPATVPTESMTSATEMDETTISTDPVAETVIETTVIETEPIVTTIAETVLATESATEPTEEMVWIPTGGGKKYHSRSSCSNMDNPSNVPLSTAIARGFTPCKRCH